MINMLKNEIWFRVIAEKLLLIKKKIYVSNFGQFISVYSSDGKLIRIINGYNHIIYFNVVEIMFTQQVENFLKLEFYERWRNYICWKT